MPLWTPNNLTNQPTFPSAPSLADFQFEINSANGPLTIGPGTPYTITDIQGLGDLPQLRITDTPRPRDTGEFMGYDYSAGRDVTIELWISAAYAGGTSLNTLLQDLAAVMIPSALTEFPLWFQLPSLPILALQCRPREKTVPYDVDWANNQVAAKVSLKFHATDPRAFEADSPTTINFPSGAGAVTYPIPTPTLTFTGAGATGSITNNGNVDADVLIEIAATGSCDVPYVASIAQNLAIAFWNPAGSLGDLAAGDVVWIDCLARSIVYWASGAAQGLPSRSWMEPGSEWFTVSPGTATIRIGSGGASSTSAVIHAPSAHML